MCTRLGQPICGLFQRAAITDSNMAYRPKCDRVTTAQFRQGPAHGLDGHGEVISDVISRHGQEHCVSRCGEVAVCHLQQERTDFLERAGPPESNHAPLQTDDGLERSLADVSRDLRVGIGEPLGVATRIAGDESPRDDRLDTELAAAGSIEPKQVTRQDEIHDVPSPVCGQRTLARGTRYDPKPVLARVIEPIDRFADVVSSEDRQALQGSERSVSRNPFGEFANRR
jgi:hypothetical protein